ncbi:PLD nuclease N-terminal domain-containing protein [Specibacter sp. NPDC057265]|uniref:PLD nuclease N-terminal domain-containing protein n=1 Tax=Specibacter sp. NPDC057265 TaxID=3346075 RepID=UPI00362EE610
MRYIIPVTIAVVLFVYGLIDCLRSEAKDVRSIPKPAWVAVIVLLNVLGVALWFLFGRPKYDAPRRQAGGAPPASRRSLAPDDDPDFLRNLQTGRAQRLEAERLRKLQADLDAREAKLREEHPNDETKK